MLKHSDGDSEKSEKVTGKPSFIEDLAKRSTGLAEHQKPLESAGDKERSPWSYAGLGIQFAATVALFAYAGYVIDRWLGWRGGMLITLTLLAVVGNLYLLIKESLRADAPAKKPPTEDGKDSK